MLDYEVVMPGDDLFDEVNRQCEVAYWQCGLLDDKSRFDYNPDCFFIVQSNGTIVATLGIFVKTPQKKLPIDGTMWYSNEKNGLQEIELGRLSFSKRPRTKTEFIETISIMKFLLKKIYLYLEQEFGSYVVYFETHKTVIKLLTVALGSAFIIPKKCLILWDQIPEEWRKYYSKYSEGAAGLYQVNLKIFKKIIGAPDTKRIYA